MRRLQDIFEYDKMREPLLDLDFVSQTNGRANTKKLDGLLCSVKSPRIKARDCCLASLILLIQVYTSPTPVRILHKANVITTT